MFSLCWAQVYMKVQNLAQEPMFRVYSVTPKDCQATQCSTYFGGSGGVCKAWEGTVGYGGRGMAWGLKV